MRRLLILASAAAVLVLAPAAAATTETAASGSVSASFSYTKTSDFQYEGLHLKITRAGQTALDAPTPPSCTGDPVCGFSPAGAGQTPSVHVIDLDGDHEPEVVLDLYSGGAHCCWYTEVYSYSPASGTYVNVERNFGESYELKDLNGDGLVEFQGFDIRFDEAFTAHAGSLQPVQIFDFKNAAFVDVTRAFPAQIAKEARYDFKFYKRFRKKADLDVRGFLAPWVADEYLLGKRKTALKVLNDAVRRGYLSHPRHTGYATGRAYVRRLKKLLAKYGYS
jgi:hypothetical protein